MGTGRKSAGTLRYVVIPGLLVLIVIAVLNFFIYRQEFNFFYNIYNNEVVGTTSLITRKFQRALTAAESIRALFISSSEVTKEEFDLFGSILMKNTISGTTPILVAVEWVDAKNIIRYVYPMDANNAKAIGLDINQRPNLIQSIIKAKTTRLPVVTEPFMLMQGYPGIVIYSPIFKGNNYLGEAEVVIRLANLLAPASGTTPTYKKDAYIQTGNFTIPFDDDVIFNNNGERIVDSQGSVVKDPISQEYLASKPGVKSEDIVFADKTWQLKLSPTYIGDLNRRLEIYAGFSILFVSAVVIFLWILQRRRVQLLKEAAKTEALILNIGDGLLACDKNGVITFTNKKTEELSGYSAEESIGKLYPDVWHMLDSKGDATPTEKRLFYRALGGEVVTISTTDHLYILRKDGTRFPLASTIAPIVVNGKAEGIIVSIRDITKESEVDRMKTEFLSLVTHQLLSPSTTIKWTVELLLDGELGELNKKQLESIKDINNSNEGMISLVNSLLNVSRIESGRLMVDPKPTNLVNLVGEVIKELKNKIEEKGQLFDLKSEENLPTINIDPNLIKQVYKNLLTNAIKYTPAKGSISVTINTVENNIISKITDNGYGILDKEKGRVFEKFYRGENIIAIEKDGNGLGLYLVKQIIEVSGGKIWFESKEGKGSKFWFSLPISGMPAKKGEVTLS